MSYNNIFSNELPIKRDMDTDKKNIQQYKVEEDDTSLYTSSTNFELKSSQNYNQNIEQQIMEFKKKYNPLIYILTPCFNGMCYVNYMTCFLNTLSFFSKFNIQIHLEFCKNDSLVSRARNNLIARAMTNKKATHFLFIDNDISWDPLDIIKLLLADKQLVGGVYPLKNYDWKKLLVDSTNPYNSNIIQSLITKKNNSVFKDLISDESMIQHNILRYNVNYLNNSLKIENNLAKVRHIATGFMMIKRSTIEKMMIAFPSTKYKDDVSFLKPEENEMAYALFDCGVEEGHYFSEDWLFCDRWSKMGGDIYIDISINLTHTGIEDYRGSYITTII